MHVTTLNDLAGQVFASVPDVASIIGRDERTVRRALEAGKIPGQKVGSRWAIPVAWLRQQAGAPEPPPDPGELADQVADRVVARLARLLAGGEGSASVLCRERRHPDLRQVRDDGAARPAYRALAVLRKPQ